MNETYQWDPTPRDMGEGCYEFWPMVQMIHGNQLKEVLTNPETGQVAEVWQRWVDEDELKQSCWRPTDMHPSMWDPSPPPAPNHKRYGVVIKDADGIEVENLILTEGFEFALITALNKVNPQGGAGGVDRHSANTGLGDMDHWIGIEEVVEITGLSRGGVRQLRVKRTKIGSHTFYDRREVEEWNWKNGRKKKYEDN